MHISLEAMTSYARRATGDVPPPLVGPSATLITYTTTIPSPISSSPPNSSVSHLNTPPLNSSSFAHPSITKTTTKILVFGGRIVSSRELVNSLWVLDLDSMVWSKVERNGNGRRDGDTDEATGDGGDGVGQEKGREREGNWPSARYFHSADVWNDKLVIFGGMGTTFIPSPPSPRMTQPNHTNDHHKSYYSVSSSYTTNTRDTGTSGDTTGTTLSHGTGLASAGTPTPTPNMNNNSDRQSSHPNAGEASSEMPPNGRPAPWDVSCVLNDLHVFDVRRMKWVADPNEERDGDGDGDGDGDALGRGEGGGDGAGGTGNDVGDTGKVGEGWRPMARYAHLGAVSGGRLVIMGGQNIENEYIMQTAIYDLPTRRWISQQWDLTDVRGSYRSVAVSSPIRVRTNPAASTSNLQQLPLTSTLNSEEQEILTFANSNFTDVKREVQSLRLVDGKEADGVPKVVETDLTPMMTGKLQPPGLRFPFGAILGSHLILAGTYLSASVQTFAVWTLNLMTWEWTRVDAIILEGNSALSGPDFGKPESWNKAALWGDKNQLVVFGNRMSNLQTDYDHRAVNFDHLAMIDLEIFGIYQPPMATSISQQMIPTALNSLREGWHSDFAMICEDGRAIRCSRRVLLERWPWFAKETAAFSKKAAGLVGDAVAKRRQVLKDQSDGDSPSEDGDFNLPLGLTEIRQTAREIYMPEPYPICVALLEYLYTLSLVTPLQYRPPILSGLLMISKQYDMPALTALTCHAMHEQLSDHTALGIYEIATLCGCTSLQVRALKMVLNQQKRSSRRPTHRKGPSSAMTASTAKSSNGPSGSPHTANSSTTPGATASSKFGGGSSSAPTRNMAYAVSPSVPSSTFACRSSQAAASSPASSVAQSPVKQSPIQPRTPTFTLVPVTTSSPTKEHSGSPYTSPPLGFSRGSPTKLSPTKELWDPLVPPVRTHSKEALRFTPSMQDIAEKSQEISIADTPLLDRRVQRKRSASSVSMHHQAFVETFTPKTDPAPAYARVRPVVSKDIDQTKRKGSFHELISAMTSGEDLVQSSRPSISDKSTSSASGVQTPVLDMDMPWVARQSMVWPSSGPVKASTDSVAVKGHVNVTGNSNEHSRAPLEQSPVRSIPRERIRVESDSSSSRISADGLFAFFDYDQPGLFWQGDVQERTRNTSGASSTDDVLQDLDLAKLQRVAAQTLVETDQRMAKYRADNVGKLSGREGGGGPNQAGKRQAIVEDTYRSVETDMVPGTPVTPGSLVATTVMGGSTSDMAPESWNRDSNSDRSSQERKKGGWSFGRTRKKSEKQNGWPSFGKGEEMPLPSQLQGTIKGKKAVGTEQEAKDKAAAVLGAFLTF